MKNKGGGNKTPVLIAAALLIVSITIGIALTASTHSTGESVSELMLDAVLHESNKISLFGIKDVNPAVIAAFTVTAILLFCAAVIRIFAIPKFKRVPGKLQMAIEKLVEFFDGMAKTNSPEHNGFIGAYIFAAGSYVFFSTLFELFGIQAITTEGRSISLPAPLSDINGAIALGCLSYLVILGGGIVHNGLSGAGKTLKDFSLPISMSFRIFGALLSGLLVTELVYYTIYLSIGLPIIVGVLFTLLHALVQTYVLVTLVSVFYGEATEPKKKKEKHKASKKLDTKGI